MAIGQDAPFFCETARMRLLYATDLHGLPQHLQELARAAERWQPRVLLIGGDALCEADMADPAGSQGRFVQTEIRHFLEAVRHRQPDINIAILFGNHDWICSYDSMKNLSGDGLVHILGPDNPTDLGGFLFLGYSYAPPSPHPVKDFERSDFPGQAYRFDGGLIWDRGRGGPVPVQTRDYLAREPSIEEDLARVPDIGTADWVLASHAPPARTDLDILSGIGHVGSESIRRFILQRQPLLSLHGHIHESPRLSGRFWQRLGRTIAVNPGQREDALAAVLIDINADAVTLTPLGVEGRSGGEPVTLPRAAARGPA